MTDDPSTPKTRTYSGFLFPVSRPGPYPRSTELAEMRSRARPPTQAFYDYWDSKRRGRLMPARSDLDALEMRDWMTGIQIIDVFHNPRRLRYRLVGAIEVQSRGFNPTGRYVEDGFIGVSREDVLYNYNTVIDQRTMLFDWGEYPCGGGYLLWQETIFLPLSSDGEIVDKVITFVIVTSV
ncbi:MAG TPA: PAS domain-containing protein [Dongiaceae bacterium]